jgi:flap endonuclease-1
MGIKNLNKFLLENCTKRAIQKIHLSNLKGKTMVIDTSIYLYKFLTENALLENMYLFISLMKKYEIKPIFIFDGKPPEEKQDLLKQRKALKKEAEEKYRELSTTIESPNTTVSYNEKINIMNEMKILKTQFVRVNNNHIKKVKELLSAYCVDYYESIRESDELCAILTKTGKAWGCFTDDMDMFIYDCPFIIRNLSLLNHTVFLYNKTAILKDLDLTDKLFREIMILSGTDYNINSKTNLFETIQWLYEYKKYIIEKENKKEKPDDFYIWLVDNTKYIDDYFKLLKIYNMFLLDTSNNNIFKNYMKAEKNIDMNKLKVLMREEGFLFL